MKSLLCFLIILINCFLINSYLQLEWQSIISTLQGRIPDELVKSKYSRFIVKGSDDNDIFRSTGLILIKTREELIDFIISRTEDYGDFIGNRSNFESLLTSGIKKSLKMYRLENEKIMEKYLKGRLDLNRKQFILLLSDIARVYFAFPKEFSKSYFGLNGLDEDLIYYGITLMYEFYKNKE